MLMAAFLSSKQAVRVQIPLFAPRRCGGIGRRGGLKIPCRKAVQVRPLSPAPAQKRCAGLTFGEDIVPCKLDLSTMRTSNSVNKACQRSEVRRIFGQSGEGYLSAEFVSRPVMGGQNAETADKNAYR